MYRHILIPTDGSELSEKAVRHGVELAKEQGARVAFVYVTLPFHSIAGEPETVMPMSDEYKSIVHDYLSADSTHALSFADTIAREEGVACDLVPVEHDHIYQGIIDVAEDRGCDLILMASHGRRGVSALLLGSETVKVLTHSKIPVLAYR